MFRPALNPLLRRVAMPNARDWLAIAAILGLSARQATEPRSALLGLPFALTWLVVEFLLGFAMMRVYQAQRPVRDRRVYVVLFLMAAVVMVGPRLLVINALPVIEVHAARIWQFLLPPVGIAGAFVAWRMAKPVRVLTPILLIQVFVLWGLADLPVVTHLTLYDLRTYLASGAHALAGGPIYLNHVMVNLPPTASEDIFLYPPPLIPLLEVAAQLPYSFVAVVWVALRTSPFCCSRWAIATAGRWCSVSSSRCRAHCWWRGSSGSAAGDRSSSGRASWPQSSW
jgi:hypothetical protein